MKTMTIQVNTTTRKAVVEVDGGAPVVCSLKKEGNETYSVVLKDKVEWPTKYYNIGALGEDRVITTNDVDCKARKTTRKELTDNNPHKIRVASISRRLMEDSEVLRTIEGVTEDEVYFLVNLAARLEQTAAQARIKDQIEKLKAELERLGG